MVGLCQSRILGLYDFPHLVSYLVRVENPVLFSWQDLDVVISIKASFGTVYGIKEVLPDLINNRFFNCCFIIYFVIPGAITILFLKPID